MALDHEDKMGMTIIVGFVFLVIGIIATFTFFKHRQIETMAKLGYCQTQAVGTSELLWEKCAKPVD